jgi:hypothetical protein
VLPDVMFSGFTVDGKLSCLDDCSD